MPGFTAPPRSWFNSAAFALLALALLTVLPAPVYVIATLAIVITEWGHLAAPVALLLAMWLAAAGGHRTFVNRLAIVAAIAATCLFCAPVVRAALIARHLPDELAARFGPPPSAHQTAGSPLDVLTLFTTPPALAIQHDTIVYASSGGKNLAMDVFRDLSTPTPRPALVVVHGGSWQGGTRTEFRSMNEHLATRGWLVASIDYRLAPRWPFPAALDDVRAAMAFLRTHASELDADPSHVALLGRSAGTQLALLAAYTRPDPSVLGVVGLYGPADLRYAFEHPNHPWILDSRATLRAYLGGSPNDLPRVYESASPIAHITGSTPPTLLIHGGRDQLVKEAQSARLDARLARAGRPHYFLRLGWGTHACDYNFTGPCGQLTAYAVDYFLDVARGRPPGRLAP